MAQEAAMPKTVLSGTEIAATSSVKRMAARASGSLIAASHACHPWRRASVSTAPSGSTSMIPT